jgi:hypothetical protein
MLANGGLGVKYVSFTDAATFYAADLASGSADASVRLYLEQCGLPHDAIMFGAEAADFRVLFLIELEHAMNDRDFVLHLDLRQRVDALLARHQAAGSFLESPAAGDSGRICLGKVAGRKEWKRATGIGARRAETADEWPAIIRK